MTSRELGASIRAHRKAQGLRQDELAAASGVGTRFIVDLEAGKTTAQVGKMLQVIDSLGLAITLAPRALS